ncbi:uncharacterized protein LOC119371762 [Rhipicephalus sanguineus]|uniref:uncharacterized protein LOC119371762 n=1 Tax=Rhipicephalus sanguineus TaxID=34632 RepID=UPI0018937848|nr:uncharacterized protein LOC119371762 [Rhipicephalus sanguineus]
MTPLETAATHITPGSLRPSPIIFYNETHGGRGMTTYHNHNIHGGPGGSISHPLTEVHGAHPTNHFLGSQIVVGVNASANGSGRVTAGSASNGVGKKQGKNHGRRFSNRIIEASLCVFLSLCVSLAGLFLGLLYQPLLLIVFACGLVALVAYLCYGFVHYKRSWRRRNSGLASYWAGHRKISVVSVDRMPTINEVLIEDNVSITKGLPEETWSGKTFVVRNGNASPES